MSKKLFAEEEIKLLSKNKYVKKVSRKGITYTDEFKRIFITENESGKSPIRVFEECGFDIDVIGLHRVRSSGKRWRASYRQNVVCGLCDTRKANEKNLSLEEKYARLEAQNKLLKAKNYLLKKLDIMERNKMCPIE